ncbi:atp-dependent rna helicase dbp10 [Phaffia rhodozyma]|uniref:RNA helicase n=1 Tax=Phaffia rhodozyma TaxID=264483 RepID=A0A0F7SHW0_PHARH|nr:atp-dependent rna helicase dbp10 [Phaffia rhodozyma]
MPPANKRKRPTLPSIKPSRAARSQEASSKKAKPDHDDFSEDPYSKKKKFEKRSDWKAKKAQAAEEKAGRGKPGAKNGKGPAEKPTIHDPRKKNRGAKKSKTEEESEDSGYEEVGGAGSDGSEDYAFSGGEGNGGGYSDSSDEDEVDITAALSGTMPSASTKRTTRPALPSQESRYSGRKSSSAPKGNEPEVGDGSDGDDDFIAEMMGKRNIEDGKAVVKETVGKKGDNGKNAKEASGGGSFQAMGLLPPLLKMILKKYKTPTPIQRLSIPSALAAPPRDIVAMSRTGSGKTLAYITPLIQRLQGRHSSSFGAKAIVLCPSRELAVQILKVGKEMARGFKNGGRGGDAGDDDDDDRRSSEIRWGLVVGGEGLDEQFEMIASNPDVIIATPGRLLHLVVEMNLDLRSVEYIVFDEADRLFEMGFELQLQEILHRLPTTRQTLLFSATLPKNLVEFAKAGLQNPKLIRLDAESKISDDLQMNFFSVKPSEKEAALLSLLRNVIGVPLRDLDEEVSETEDEGDEERSRHGGKRDFKKNKKGGKFNKEKIPKLMAPHQTLVFAATKHHVDYLSTMLTAAGYAVSHIYGSLDQTARKQQMDRFRRGKTSILVVTDVAARGIDVPVLENVVNYDFPTGARVFVHRVGRTARAGRKGCAYSFVTNTELPFFLDLQLFLGKSLVNARAAMHPGYDRSSSMFLGTIPRDTLDADLENIATSLTQEASSLPILKEVVRKGQAMYERSNGKASQESYRRAKEMTKDPSWGLAGSTGEEAAIHPTFSESALANLVNSSSASAPGIMSSSGTSSTSTPIVPKQSAAEVAAARAALLASVNSFRPNETIFEIGHRGKNQAFKLMQDRRKTLSKVVRKTEIAKAEEDAEYGGAASDADSGADGEGLERAEVDMADEDDLESAFGTKKKKAKSEGYKDPEFYMSHYQSGAEHDTKGYSMRDGASFIEQAKGATMDLAGDDGIVSRVQRSSQITWDRKKKKFVKGDGVGSDNKKMVKTESGARLPATFRSGRFDEWKAKNKTSLPRIGEAEPETSSYGNRAFNQTGSDGRRFRHNKFTEAKPLDKTSTSYERKMRVIEGKKRAEAEGKEVKSGKGRGVGGRGGRGAAAVKSEIKSVHEIKKQRDALAKRKEKNARPSKKGGKGKGRGRG